jgi:hypothetical protein
MGVAPADSKRRILTIVQALSTGGTERVAATYAIAYAAMGFESSILGLYGGGVLEPTLLEGGVHVWSGPESLAQLRRQGETLPWQLIHIHNGGQYDPYSDWLVGLLKGPATRVVQTNVFARADYGPKPDVIDFEILISQVCAWKWRRWAQAATRQRPNGVFPYLVDEGRFRVPDAAERQQARLDRQLPPSAKVIGRIGQPSAAKWDRQILDVFRLIQKRLPDTHLLLVGCPADICDEISTLPAAVRKGIRVFPASSDDQTLQTAYWALDVFLHLSQIGESFGLVLVEAAQSGVPIVAKTTPLKDNSQAEVVRIMAAGASGATNEEVADQTIDRLTSCTLEQERSAIASQANLAFGIRSNRARLKQWVELLIDSGDPAALTALLDHQHAHHPCWRRSTAERFVGEAVHGLGPLNLLAFHLIHHPWIYRQYRTWRERPYLRQQRRRVGAHNQSRGA